MRGISLKSLVDLLEMLNCPHIKLETIGYNHRIKESTALCPVCKGKYRVFRDGDIDEYPLNS